MSKKIRPKRSLIVNPINGRLDYVTENNFSYESVPQNKILIIPENHQMLLRDEFQVEGNLEIDGSLVVEE